MSNSPSSTDSASPPPVAALAGAAAPPTTATWPDEIWVLVLDQLDYKGLHKAAQLCKKLKRFIEDESFDVRLFRTRVKPPKKLIPNSTLEIHPLLAATYGVFTGKDALTWASMGGDDGEEHTAFEYPAVDEYATWPPATIMHVDVGVGKSFPVTDRNGIKVRRVLQRLGHFWGSKATSTWAWNMAAEYHCPPDEVTWQMALGDRNGWTGWEEAVVENEATAVRLTACGYDS
ncbi:hypothetical protein JCM3775_003387 [Rhodotorula graminis]